MTESMAELTAKRAKYVESARENGFEEGIKRLLAELYPDNAHFIYELLQNAEDARASEVRFVLEQGCARFVHNGSRLFSSKDVDSITGIGISTKRDDPTSIGKFGVGFKAVFAYTNTPEIHSDVFHFRIRDLVVPEALTTTGPELETRFRFPFDNPKKTASEAVAEVAQGLNALDHSVLLFLRHIRKIRYTLPDGSWGTLERTDQEDGRLLISSRHPNSPAKVFEWLLFQKDVEVNDGNGKCQQWPVAIAFPLEQEYNSQKGSSEKAIATLKPGQVFIYFPAEKEVSNLHFHLHALFASTVARDSVRDCNGNEQLRNGLAELTAESLNSIRVRGLLTASCLATLPCPEDGLPLFYEPIRERLLLEFRANALTPTQNGTYARAVDVFSDQDKISKVIGDADLRFLTAVPQAQWAIRVTPGSRASQFLNSLGVHAWGKRELGDVIRRLFSPKELAEDARLWIQRMPCPQLQSLYRLLAGMEIGDSLRVIRTEKGDLAAPIDVFLRPDRPVGGEEEMEFVDESLVKGGGAERFDEVRKALRTLGVRTLQECHILPVISRRYSQLLDCIIRGEAYSAPRFDVHLSDVRRLVHHVIPCPCTLSAPLFAGGFEDFTMPVFFAEDGHLWPVDRLRLPGETMEVSRAGDGECKRLHECYFATGLAETREFVLYFRRNRDSSCGLPLLPSEVTADENPDIKRKMDGKGRGDVGEDSDWNLPASIIAEGSSREAPSDPQYFAIRFDGKQSKYRYSADRAFLLWEMMRRAERKHFLARYEPSRKYSGSKSLQGRSLLVMHLSNMAWIPDRSGAYHKPSEMTASLLPDYLEFDNSNGWLTEIEFGGLKAQPPQTTDGDQSRGIGQVWQKVLEAGRVLRGIGINSISTGQLMKLEEHFARNPERLQRLLAEISRKEDVAFPTRPVANVERRKSGILEELRSAPAKEYHLRQRSVRTSSAPTDARSRLRSEYTNERDQMFCQICREEMPFRTREGQHYFEAVEAFDDFPCEVYWAYLALCPLCAAMYKYFVKSDTSRSAMLRFKTALQGSAKPDVPLMLGDLRTIRFVETHFTDLKTALQAQSEED